MKRFLLLMAIFIFLTGCGPVAESFNQKGGRDFHQGDLAAAQKEFRRAVFFNSSNPAYHNNLGYVLYQLRDYDGADTEYQKALTDHPDGSLLRQIQMDQVVLYCDGAALREKPSRKDWNQKGISLLNALLVKERDNAELHMRLGFAYFQGSNPGGGFMELDKAAQLATPAQVAKYSSGPVQGSLFVLQQIETFYLKIRYLSKAAEIQKRISGLEGGPKALSTKP